VRQGQLFAEAKEVFGVEDVLPGRLALLEAAQGQRTAVGRLPVEHGKSAAHFDEIKPFSPSSLTVTALSCATNSSNFSGGVDSLSPAQASVFCFSE